MCTGDRATSAAVLTQWVGDARARTLDLVADLDDDQLIGPHLPTTNPLIWEIAHAAWFQEKWVLRHVARRAPLRADGDQLFDSIAIPHEVRWDLPVPSRRETIGYLCEVRDRVQEVIDRGPLTEPLVYFVKLSVFHEDMHTEAFTYTRQTLGYLAPRFSQPSPRTSAEPPADPAPLGDAELSGGTFALGATRDDPFVFDNEKWSHEVRVEPFAIGRAAVTQQEFAEFVEDDGYRRQELWSPEGWSWREKTGAERPVYWKRDTGGGWLRRDFDQWKPLEPRWPVIHVNWYEADAWCRWAGRRLPTEAEWELAAAAPCAGPVNRDCAKRHYPWGDELPSPARANLDWQAMHAIDVDTLATGDSACGCRQMIGNVWEWTADDFLPFPGFEPDPYKEYSQPCFQTRKVLRGGCWATRSRLLRNTWRNYYEPYRRDVWCGFRTCERVEDGG